MITRVTIKRFKKLTNVSISLDDHIVFAGPNNSGKTTAIQALAVWRLALTKWLEKRDKAKSKATLRTGVAISRPDLIALPLRDMKFLWHDCEVQDSDNKKIRVEIAVEGKTRDKEWHFGMELEHAGPQQIYCRPMRVAPDSDDRMPVPNEARDLTIVHLPPLAGLQRAEDKVNERSLKTRISEGRAGDILRNLLLNVAEKNEAAWKELKKHVATLFQVELLPPQFLSTGEIVVEYYNGLPRANGRNPHTKLDLGMGGSGFHQILLLLAFLYDQAGAVLMFDEPDAHLEIIRQRDVYRLLRQLAKERDAQLIISTHSEVILDQTPYANICAFLGDSPRPLATDQKASQLRKASDYLQAQERNGVLYVEDYTDVDILLEWAKLLKHPAMEFLQSPFVVYVGNVPKHARDHFYGLQSAHPSLRGVLLLDQTETTLRTEGPLTEIMWRRREIENYLLVPEAILRFCERELRVSLGAEKVEQEISLFSSQIPDEMEIVRGMLKKRILEEEFAQPLIDTPFFLGTKASEVVLEPFFNDFYKKIGKSNAMRKNSFYRLAAEMKKEEIPPEVKEKLDHIAVLAR
jgi:energy-coupling factor transporter ATP-binding protein EcfA2